LEPRLWQTPDDRARVWRVSDILDDLRYMGEGTSIKDVEDEFVTVKGGKIEVGIGSTWWSARMSVINPNKEA
jgi:hypothetical protein